MKMSLKPRVKKSLSLVKKNNVSCMRPMRPMPLQGKVFFLHRRIAHDSCGQVPARLVKKKSTSAHLETTKTKPQPKTPKNNTKPTSELE